MTSQMEEPIGTVGNIHFPLSCQVSRASTAGQCLHVNTFGTQLCCCRCSVQHLPVIAVVWACCASGVCREWTGGLFVFKLLLLFHCLQQYSLLSVCLSPIVCFCTRAHLFQSLGFCLEWTGAFLQVENQ